MSRTKILSTILLSTMLLGGTWTAEAGKANKKKPAAAAKVSPENKKALLELMGAFKFGMTKDEVVAALTKALDDRYAEQIAATTDIYTQDKLRKEKKEEVARITKSYTEFTGKKSGWDVSIIDTEFGHNNDEAMLVYWENQGGKNQRRFFFFHEGKLYKMIVALDTKQVDEEQRTFTFFAGLMQQRFGKGKQETPGSITWRTDNVAVQAVDKIQFYDAFCLVISDSNEAKAIAEARASKAPPKAEGNKILQSVTEKGPEDKPSLDEGKDVLKGIIDEDKRKKK